MPGWRVPLREATPYGQIPKYLICDHDIKFGSCFRRVVMTSGIKLLKTPVHVPQANAICERYLRSVRQECLDHLLIFGEKQLQHVLNSHVAYFNQARPHQGIVQQIPEPSRSALFSHHAGEKIGFNADHDCQVRDDLRFVQLTPPGSACSIVIGVGITGLQPGSLKGLQMVVQDVKEVRDELVKRGVDVSDTEVMPWGSFVFLAIPMGIAGHYSSFRFATNALSSFNRRGDLIATCVLRNTSKMGEVGHGTEALRIGFQLIESVTHLVNDLIERGQSEIRQVLFALCWLLGTSVRKKATSERSIGPILFAGKKRHR